MVMLFILLILLQVKQEQEVLKVHREKREIKVKRAILVQEVLKEIVVE
jgi:hypothetical protein